MYLIFRQMILSGKTFGGDDPNDNLAPPGSAPRVNHRDAPSQLETMFPSLDGSSGKRLKLYCPARLEVRTLPCWSHGKGTGLEPGAIGCGVRYGDQLTHGCRFV